MAKANLKCEVSITLTLNEEEANFLCGYLQNWVGRPGDESPDHTRLRTGLFNALKQTGIGNQRTPHATPRTDLDVMAELN
ncbi:hypothetical protein KIT04_093 [Vibrio phage KIT04]|nr:hypothetical protein KIT04_093 [Vibrio phage KIT04]